MESPQDFPAHRHAPNRQLSRRSLLGWSAAAAAAGLFTACTARDENASGGRVLFEDVFAGNSLSRTRWNPYMCDNNSHGWPWLMQPSVAVPSSAIGGENGFSPAYDLPSAIHVDDGLTLRTYRGTRAAGYSWTGSVICSRPTSNNFGSGIVRTAGFTFQDARVEVRAKMPDLTGGQWPSIWFLPAWDDNGAEIDLFEGGFLPSRSTLTNSWRSSCSAAATSSNSWIAALTCPPAITLTRWNTGRAAQLRSSLTTRTSTPTRATCRSALTSSSCPTASHRRVRPAGTPRSATPRRPST